MPPIKHIKQAGYTMNQTIDMYKHLHNIDAKVCYCGRLDPMARGLVYLLIGDDCKMMPFYNSHSKEYTFEILFGMSTDTDDPLGIISNMDFNCYTPSLVDNIKDYIMTLPSTFMQEYHDYSSKKYKGKSLWWYAKNNIEIKKPSHEVTIKSIMYHDIKQYNSYEWVRDTINSISLIDKTNNFRQEETIAQYNKIDYKGPLYCLPITINVTSGFYIRQLVCDIKKHLKVPIMTFDINRKNIMK
jgi:tRNA pseudouridine(55) synthase